MRKFFFFGIVILLFSSIVPVAAQDDTEASSNWWEGRVWYLLFVRSFYDSDGDGIGDIQGIIEKLDYLNDGDPNTTDDLGITAIWLMPIMESNAYHGYWITDFYSVESDYGTREDFEELMAEAHARGIRIIIDFVGNHVSSENPWFQAALAGDPEFEDWFIWEDENPNYRGPWGAQTWWQSINGRWYYGIFDRALPDLNYNNPEVSAAIRDVARFWIQDMGVDGFRIDGARYWIESEYNGNPVLADATEQLQYMAEFTDYVHSLNPEAITIAEVWASTSVISRYIREDSFDAYFEFSLAEEIIDAATTGSKWNIELKLPRILETYESQQLATFTTNHDQARLLTQLRGDEGANRVAANLLLTLPGAPFLYYGEEIGMMGRSRRGDENIRLPMQWDDSPTGGGFTTGRPWYSLQDDYQERNVAGQTNDPDSLLSHYRNLIQLRNQYPALQYGLTIPVRSSFRVTWGYLRYTDDEVLLIVLNLDDKESRNYTFTIEEGPLETVSSVDVLFSTTDVMPNVPEVNENGGFTDYVPIEAPLPPQSIYVLRLNP
jgi:alpha-amylase